MFKQMFKYFVPFFSKFQCSFRKGFSAKQCLLSMLEKWKSAADNQKRFVALLTNFSKAFDCLSHVLLIAKLNAYGFRIDSTKICTRLFDKSQRKNQNKFSTQFMGRSFFGVSQGSVLGPLLFNIFLCDLFFIMDDIDFASYADDNTPYTIGTNMEDVIFKLRNSSKILFQCFMDNQTKAHPDKCYFICSTNDTVNLINENQIIDNSKYEKLLGVKFDYKLTFNAHIDDLCKKAGLKLNSLSKIAPLKRLLGNIRSSCLNSIIGF